MKLIRKIKAFFFVHPDEELPSLLPIQVRANSPRALLLKSYWGINALVTITFGSAVYALFGRDPFLAGMGVMFTCVGAWLFLDVLTCWREMRLAALKDRDGYRHEEALRLRHMSVPRKGRILAVIFLIMVSVASARIVENDWERLSLSSSASPAPAKSIEPRGENEYAPVRSRIPVLTGSPCMVGVGACRASGVWVQDGSGLGFCGTAQGQPTDEVCDGIDNDCDYVVDDMLIRSCYTDTGGAPLGGNPGLGQCRLGSRMCTGGSWTDCVGAIGPSFEICDDGIDNDCDGTDLPCR